MAKKITFENYLEEVETVVRKLEQGSLSLDESLVAYERGRKALAACTKILDEAEKKVVILLDDGKGGRNAVPFREGEERA